jgi:hypothetical protein
MASPHVAGEAALVRGAHRGWSVEQVKAAIMNTATQDVFVGPSHTGDVYGPERVGSGRVKADDAVNTGTLAYNKDDAGAVSVSFGPLAVTKDTTLTKTIHVENTRVLPSQTVSYALSYTPAHATPGVTYTVSPSSVTLAPGSSADVKVSLHVVRSQLRHTTDPTSDRDPAGIGLERSYRTDASGRVILTPTNGTDGSALRVPVWSAPRPASAMHAASTTVVASNGESTLPLAGQGVDQGSGTTGVLSTVSALQLQRTSAALPSCAATTSAACVPLPDDRSADLRYVGSTSDAPLYTENELDPLSWDPAGDGSLPPATLSFGVSAYGPWRTPASYTEFDVMLDTNADGTPDAAVYNTRLAGSDDYDYFLAETVDLRPGKKFAVLDQELLNLADGSFDTGVFNSDSLTMTVALAGLKDAGLVADSTRSLRYWVESYTAESGQIDAAGSAGSPITVTYASPGVVAFGDSLTIASTDLPGAALAVHRDAASVRTDKPLGLLLLHHLNTDGNRAQVVRVKVASSTHLKASATRYNYGGRPVFTATVAPSDATGKVTFKDGYKVVATVPVSHGKATFTARNQARGTHRMRAYYSGDGTYVPSASPVVSVYVVGRTSYTKLSSSRTDYRYGYRPTLTATVPYWASGTVVFTDGWKELGRRSVSHGKAALWAPVLSRGTHHLRATYYGNSAYYPSRSTWVTVTVR